MAFNIAAILLAAATAQAAPPGAVRPSFSCAAKLTPVEAMICKDEELSAYDRAMSFVFADRLIKKRSDTAKQVAWLKRRNLCANRACLLDAYVAWFNDEHSTSFAASTHERHTRRPDGSDLMLGTLQSPTGRVNVVTDDGDLYLRPLGSGWYIFHASAIHIYDPHDGRGTNSSDSEASWEVVRITNGKGRFGDSDCGGTVTLLKGGAWRLTEDEGFACSGLGSSLDGDYYPSR